MLKIECFIFVFLCAIYDFKDICYVTSQWTV